MTRGNLQMSTEGFIAILIARETPHVSVRGPRHAARLALPSVIRDSRHIPDKRQDNKLCFKYWIVRKGLRFKAANHLIGALEVRGASVFT